MRIGLILAYGAMLASCGSEPEIKMENASVGEVAQEMREAGTQSFLNAGKWQHSITVLEMDVPGMPPQAREMMQRAYNEKQSFEHCLTPEQARKPSEEFFANANKNCRYDHFNWGDGKIDLKMNCDGDGGTLTMVQTGTYEPNGYTMDVSQVIESTRRGSPGQIRIKAKVDAKRIGQCDGTEEARAGTQ